MLKKLFCKHRWQPYAKRESSYFCDFVSYSDVGKWTDVIYKCSKCKRTKVRTFAPYHEERLWENLTEAEKILYKCS